MLGNCIENVRKSVPLVHNITNYVTVNDVANALLACGGSPIMSDEPEDVKEITSICQGLNINIGTLNKRTIEGMFAAGARANELGHVTLLDRSRCKWTADEYRRRTDGESPIRCYTRKYLRSKNTGTGKRNNKRGGCRCSRCRNRGESGRRYCICESICEKSGMYCCDYRCN